MQGGDSELSGHNSLSVRRTISAPNVDGRPVCSPWRPTAPTTKSSLSRIRAPDEPLSEFLSQSFTCCSYFFSSYSYKMPELSVCEVDSPAKEHNDDVSDFADGEFDPSILPLVLESIDSVFGMWELLKERSESADAIMKALGVGMMKRMAINNCSTSVELKPIACVKGRPSVYMTSFLPLNNKKEGDVFVDNVPFDYDDGDAGVWTTSAKIVGGRILQKRTSPKGVMFDIRGTFATDPKGIIKDCPLQLFQWTYIDTKGKKISCERWFKKCA